MKNEKITVLYVDDEPINLKVFELNFKRKFNILTAISGFDGLEILRSNHEIDVVVSDMKMPGMSGIDFITKAKSDFPIIRYYILTGFDITKEIAEALDSKLILKYFRKPFEIKEIEATLNNLDY